MNKFGVAVALVAVLVGLVTISSVSGSPSHLKKSHPAEEPAYEQETGELERPPPRHQTKYRVVETSEEESQERPAHHRPEPAKGYKAPGRGRREHPPPQPVAKKPEGRPSPPAGKKPPPPRKGGPHYQAPPKPRVSPGVCHCSEGGRHHEGSRPEHGRGGQESEGEESGPGGESGGEGANEGGKGHGPESEGEESGRGEESSGHEGGNEQGKRHGSFKGAGAFGGFKKEKEFDGSLRGSSKQNNRNQFQKQKTFVGGEQKAFNGGSSTTDVNTVDGLHRRKNVNNDRLVVKESQRGNEDTEAFRGQSGHNEETHFGASDTKVFGAQGAEQGSSEQDNEKEFEGEFHKKNNVGAFGGAGAVSGRF